MSIGIEKVNKNIEKLTIQLSKEKEKKRELMKKERLLQKKVKIGWEQHIGGIFDTILSEKYPEEYCIGMEAGKLQDLVSKVVKNDVTRE